MFYRNWIAALLWMPIVLAITPATASNAPSVIDEIRQLEHERYAAQARGNIDVLRSILADDLVLCHTNSRCEGKVEYLKGIESPSPSANDIRILDLQVRVLGDASIVNGQVALTRRSEGTSVETRIAYMDVYLKRDGRWQLVAVHTNLIARK